MSQRDFVDMKLNIDPGEFKRQYLNYPSPPPEEMAAQAERMTVQVMSSVENAYSLSFATICKPSPLPTIDELYDAMRAMKAQCDRIASQIPDTQIMITGTVKGPPKGLAQIDGGNVFIAFPRRNPIDLKWLAPWLKDVKAYEALEGYFTKWRTLQIPARQTDGTWVMLDLLKPVDGMKFPDGWKPLCELED